MMRGNSSNGSDCGRIKWRAAARESLLEIVDYISDDNPQAAVALMDEIDEKVVRLLQNPAIHRQGRVAGTRELVVRPNYIVVYMCSDENIVIIQVLHAAQQWPL